MHKIINSLFKNKPLRLLNDFDVGDDVIWADDGKLETCVMASTGYFYLVGEIKTINREERKITIETIPSSDEVIVFLNKENTIHTIISGTNSYQGHEALAKMDEIESIAVSFLSHRERSKDF